MAAAPYIKPPLISWNRLGSGVYAAVTMSQKVSGVSMAVMTTKLGNRQARQGRATMRQPPGWERMDEVFHCGGSGAEETGTVHGTGATLDIQSLPARRDIVASGFKSAGQRD
jgi:hypothetical protein